MEHLTAKKALIVGGGFIGYHLADRMARSGAAVTVFSRSFSYLFERDEPGSVTRVEGTTADESLLRGLIAECGLVIACASRSTPQTAVHDPAGSLIGATAPILEILRAMVLEECPRIAVMSSGGTVYGIPSECPTTEEASIEPCSEHGFNNSVIEQAVQLFHRMHGIEYQICRLANVYGPGERTRGAQGVIAHWLQAAANGQPLKLIGNEEVERDFIFVEDACAAIDAALSHGRWPGVYNIGGGTSTTLGELLDSVAAVVGEHEVKRLPGREGDLPRTMLATDRLRSETSWQPVVSIEEGLRRTWNAIGARQSSRDAVLDGESTQLASTNGRSSVASRPDTTYV